MVLETKELIESDLDFRSKLCELLILRDFFVNSFFSSDYIFPPQIDEAIKLTSSGKKIASLNLKDGEHTKAEHKLEIFDTFYFNDFLIDVEQTDIHNLKNIFSNEIISGNIRVPWRYERTLYDRFFDNFNIRPDILDEDKTNKLLDSTPMGVFQYGKNIIGPFGFLESEESRFLPINKSAPLWHCSDLSCRQLHFVKLTSFYEESKFKDLSNKLNIQNLPKHFAELLNKYCSENVILEHDTFSLPFTLINAFNFDELKKLLKVLINNNSYFRSKRSVSSILNKKISGSAEHISEQVNLAECFQLILTFKNIDIISALEDLIFNNEIHIPSTEVRQSYFGYNRGASLNLKCEVSSLGVRFISKNRGLPTLRLKYLIMAIYNDKEEFDWKLRLVNGIDSNDKFEYLLMNENPKQIVKDFLLDNPKHIKFTFEYLLIDKFYIPKDEKEEDALVNKLLWKLGFNVKTFPNVLKKYWEHLGKLNQASATMHIYNESDKEKIRSAAVNLFVSLEEILDASLSFITWVLLSDHYGETKFKYNLIEARTFMSQQLSGKKITDNGPIIFDSNGKNTLYPLIMGYEILADYCKELLDNRDSYKRDKKDIPSYVENTDLFVFPFNHTKLVLDLSDEVYDFLESLLRKTKKLLDCNNVASVRNRVEHKREDFPENTEIKKVCEALNELGHVFEKYGIYPVVYQFNDTAIDSFGRGFNSYVNYKEEKIFISKSSQYSLAKIPNLMDTLVILRAIKLENSNEYLRFIYTETSEYTKMYKDFPKRLT